MDVPNSAASAANVSGSVIAGNEQSTSVLHNPGGFVDWWQGTDTPGHNEAIYAWQREEASAARAREDAWGQKFFDAGREDNQFQRKVEDYMKAGFSPLAALEGNGNYAGNTSASSAQAHSEAAKGGAKGNFGTLLGSIIGALAMIASKGMSTSAKAAEVATKTAANAELAREKAAVTMAVADKSTQAKLDAARIIKFGDKITRVGELPRVDDPSAAKRAFREKLFAIKKPGEDGYLWDNAKEAHLFMKKHFGTDDIPYEYLRPISKKK